MARLIMREESNLTRIRVFKWNQTLPENTISPGEGLLMLMIKEEIITVSRRNHNDKDVISWTIPETSRFSLETLSSKDNMEKQAREALQETYKFQQDGVHELASKISEYLVSNFCFSVETLSRSNAAKLVIVVDIDLLKEFGQVNFLGGKNRELTYGIETIVCSLKTFLKLPTFYSPKPIAGDEPVGLVEVAALRMFEKCDGGALEEDACVICLEELGKQSNIRKTSCSHVFHGGCLALWLWRKQSCPMCRSQLP